MSMNMVTFNGGAPPLTSQKIVGCCSLCGRNKHLSHPSSPEQRSCPRIGSDGFSGKNGPLLFKKHHLYTKGWSENMRICFSNIVLDTFGLMKVSGVDKYVPHSFYKPITKKTSFDQSVPRYSGKHCSLSEDYFSISSHFKLSSANSFNLGQSNIWRLVKG